MKISYFAKTLEGAAAGEGDTGGPQMVEVDYHPAGEHRFSWDERPLIVEMGNGVNGRAQRGDEGLRHLTLYADPYARGQVELLLGGVLMRNTLR